MLKGFFRSKLFNFILVYLGWILCLQQVIQGHPYRGAVAATLVICFHFLIATTRKSDLKLLLTMALMGTILDTCYIALGIIKYHGTYFPWMAPLWITILWGLLSLSIGHSLAWLKGHWLIEGSFGAVGAPLTYLAAVKAGAAQFTSPLWIALLTIGGAWFFVLPLLFKLSTFYARQGEA